MPASSPTRAANVQRTLRLLLIPQPLLSLAYLAGVRTEMVTPSFMPVLFLTGFPLIAGIGAIMSLRGRSTSPRYAWVVLAIALLELGWAVMTLAIVGFAIGLRSG